jgi:hypothetical protein
MAVAACWTLQGQNLNPTIEVTNVYEGSMVEIRKPEQKMNIPDSVGRFNLAFDYSVFENPYEGAYEFSPYRISMKPEAASAPERRFFLRAGAGYGFHPELDVVYSPLTGEKLRLDVFAGYGGYAGKYRSIKPLTREDGTVALTRDGKESWLGYDMSANAGASLRFGWETGEITSALGYNRLMTKDPLLARGLDAIEASGRVRSLRDDSGYFLYDASLKYRYSHDASLAYGSFPKEKMLGGHMFSFDGSFGPVFDEGHRVIADIDVDLSRFTGLLDGFEAMIAFAPSYRYVSERWKWSLGLVIGAFIGNDNTPGAGHLPMNGRKGQIIYPDLKASFFIPAANLSLYASATGGPSLENYSALTEKNHWFNPHYGSIGCLMDNSFERVNAKVGFKGNIADRFVYDLSGGYVRKGGAVTDAVLPSVRPDQAGFYPAISFADWGMWYADFGMSWLSSSFEFTSHTSFKKANIRDSYVFAPALVSGENLFAYSWKGRVKAGLGCDFASARKATLDVPAGTVLKIPGWVDASLYAEYAFTRKMGFWVKAGNLLNMTIQRTPYYAERGIYFTAGLFLTF